MTTRGSRYGTYDVLAKWHTADWDDPTRAVVRRRLERVPPIRFFTAAETRTLAAVAEQIVPQPDRSPTDRVPIVAWIDEKLFHDRRDGYRYEGLPPLREAWRLGLAGIDQTAHVLHRRPFAELAPASQREVLQRIGDFDAPGDTWAWLPSARFFRDILCLTVVKVYYAHPTAWSEIGYSGPSSPRGHVRNWLGGVDPWDASEDES